MGLAREDIYILGMPYAECYEAELCPLKVLPFMHLYLEVRFKEIIKV